MNREVVVVDGMRTAFGRLGGSLRSFYTTDLCAAVWVCLHCLNGFDY